MFGGKPLLTEPNEAANILWTVASSFVRQLDVFSLIISSKPIVIKEKIEESLPLSVVTNFVRITAAPQKHDQSESYGENIYPASSPAPRKPTPPPPDAALLEPD